jgi:hypothetical protein
MGEDVTFQGPLMAMERVGSGSGQRDCAIDGGAEVEATLQPFSVQAGDKAA